MSNQAFYEGSREDSLAGFGAKPQELALRLIYCKKNLNNVEYKGDVCMNDESMLNKIKLYVLFAAPAMITFIAVVIVPVVYGVYLTFTGWDGVSNAKPFVGFENYIDVFKDTEFWMSLWLTVKYVFVSVIFINIISFLLGFLLTSGIKNQNFLRAGFFTPNLIGGIVLGFIWKFVFSRAFVSLGSSLGIEQLEISWLSDPKRAFWALIVVTVWSMSGYMMLIYISGFMNVPKDLLEAASIDGCTGIQKVRHITIPMMANSFVVCIFLSITRCFMVYDVNLSLTEGGPFAATRMAAMHVYKKAFQGKMYGLGQAEAIVLFAVVALIAITQVYVGKSKEVEA